uniref:ShKT domain-containing protein n=1 Tax=Trichobilharzia regenti TaxID=157069 RepID=A0AA85KEX3_TRIRE|nr:unnamed protein product [Trichobilharzia regenti]
MQMLFNCLVAILFLLACGSIYAAKSYHEECTTECNKCEGMCRGGYLACSENSSKVEQFEQCKATCVGDNLSPENCRANCELVTHNQGMCETVCVDNYPDFLPICLFYCSETSKLKKYTFGTE